MPLQMFGFPCSVSGLRLWQGRRHRAGVPQGIASKRDGPPNRNEYPYFWWLRGVPGNEGGRVGRGKHQIIEGAQLLLLFCSRVVDRAVTSYRAALFTLLTWDGPRHEKSQSREPTPNRIAAYFGMQVREVRR